MGQIQDQICFQKLVFYGYHGCFQHETLRGQEFEIDLELCCDLWNAGQSDLLQDSVDYGQVYCLVKEAVTQQRFRLLEALAQYICQKIFASYPPVQEIHLSIKKAGAPLEGGIIADKVFTGESQPIALPPWKAGSFRPGGGVLLKLRRNRRQFQKQADI